MNQKREQTILLPFFVITYYKAEIFFLSLNVHPPLQLKLPVKAHSRW
jgi:hypothetical protein